MSGARYRRVLLGLALGVLVVGPLAVAVGAVPVSPLDILGLFAWKLGLAARPDVSRALEVIVLDLRLPRVVLAAVVGAALAASGTVFQAVFRNALADPAIIGVSSGAALGAVLVIVTVGAGSLAGLGVPLAAFLGALATGFLVYRLARVGPTVHVATLLLAGLSVILAATSFLG